jgi:WD40 repeat protein
MDMKKVIAIGALAVSFLAWRMGAMTGNPKVMVQPENGLAIAMEKNTALRFDTIKDLYTSLADEEGNLKEPIPVHVSAAVLNALIKEVESPEKAESAAGKSAQTSLADMIDYLGAAEYLGSTELVALYGRRIAERLATDDGLKELSSNTNMVNKIPYESGMIIANLMPERSSVPLFILPGTFPHPEKFNFSPDGNSIVCGCNDKTIRILDASTGAERGIYNGHTGSIRSVMFSPNSENVLSASKDGTAQIWNATTGKLVYMGADKKNAASQVSWATFSPNGKLVLTIEQDYARLWNANTGAMMYSLNEKPSYGTFSPDGQWAIVSSRDHSVQIWNVQSGELQHTLAGHTNVVNVISFTKDGTKFLTSSRGLRAEDYTVRVWGLMQGTLLRTITTQKQIRGAAISPDGNNIITVNDSALTIWDMEAGAAEFAMAVEGWSLEEMVLDFSPDVSRVLLHQKKELTLFDIESRTSLPFVSPIRSATSAVFSFDGTRLFIENHNSFKGAPSAAAVQLLPKSSLPGVKELDAKIFVALLCWAHTKKAKIAKTDWVVKMLQTIQWNEVEAWDKKLLKSWIREVMEHNI